MAYYELVDYGQNAARATAERLVIYAPTDAVAFSRAGTWAKKIDGPVDIARLQSKEVGETVDWADWADRYLTTVSPSFVHAKGWRQERIC